MKRRITLVILVTLSTWMALAEDFTTVNGREYKDATVSHVEPDGIVLKTKSGISKVYFSELPKEVQERFVPSTPKMGAAQRGLIKLKSSVPTVANPTSFVLLSIGVASLVVVGLFGIAKAVMRRPKRIDRPSVARKRGL